MSTKATILALVTTLAAEQNDAVMSDRYFNEVMFDLAKDNWFVNVTVVAPPASGLYAAVQAYPDTAVNLLGVFYGAHQLELAMLRDIEYVDPQWRDATGEPICYIDEGETAHTYRLYPAPTVPPTSFAALFGEILGRGYPDNAIVVLHSETRELVPDYMDVPIALLVCEREFVRESDHQHPVFAKACGEMARIMLQMTRPRMMK